MDAARRVTVTFFNAPFVRSAGVVSRQRYCSRRPTSERRQDARIRVDYRGEKTVPRGRRIRRRFGVTRVSFSG